MYICVCVIPVRLAPAPLLPSPPLKTCMYLCYLCMYTTLQPGNAGSCLSVSELVIELCLPLQCDDAKTRSCLGSYGWVWSST